MSQSAYARLDPPATGPVAVVAAPRRLATLPFDEPVAFIPPKARPARRRRRARIVPALVGLAALSAAGWAMVVRPPGEAPPTQAAEAEAAPAPAPRAAVRAQAWLFEPAPAMGDAAAGFGRDAPLVPSFRRAAVPVQLAAAPADAPAAPSEGTAPVRTLAALPAAPVRLAAVEPAKGAIPAATPVTIPLPVPRPAELSRALAAPAQRVAAHRALPRTRDVFRAAMAEEPSFFEKLFGTGRADPARQEAPRQEAPRQEAPRQALAYADPGVLPEAAPRPRISPAPEASPSAGTAVYDISAGRVTLPSGEVLEAHSGLGEMMDNPRYVHVRMRGSTPPATYDLRERESLFHGVRAIRLNPVGGSGAIHGRDGLLAHTYMLRQPGASNGCVSFRDYDRFLQAFLRGEVRRLVVVAGAGPGDVFASRRTGIFGRRGRRA